MRRPLERVSSGLLGFGAVAWGTDLSFAHFGLEPTRVAFVRGRLSVAMSADWHGSPWGLVLMGVGLALWIYAIWPRRQRAQAS
jgi:hypothetical protein